MANFVSIGASHCRAKGLYTNRLWYFWCGRPDVYSIVRPEIGEPLTSVAHDQLELTRGQEGAGHGITVDVLTRDLHQIIDMIYTNRYTRLTHLQINNNSIVDCQAEYTHVF